MKNYLNPHVSVIIPTYNRANLVTYAIDSVLAQTYKNYEIIVIDDGSTDNTFKLLNPYMDRIVYIYQENKGKSNALNKALMKARGTWIAFLDSDDRWLPEKLEWQIQALEKYNPYCGACFTNGTFFGSPSLSESTIFRISQKNFSEPIGIIDKPTEYVLNAPHGIYVPTLNVKSELIRQINGFDENMPVAEDTDFIFRLSLVTKFCFVNIALVFIDRTPKREVGLIETFTQKPDIALYVKQHMYQKWLKIIGQTNFKARKIIVRRLQEVHDQWFKLYLKKSEYKKALQSLIKSIMLRFFKIHG